MLLFSSLSNPIQAPLQRSVIGLRKKMEKGLLGLKCKCAFVAVLESVDYLISFNKPSRKGLRSADDGLYPSLSIMVPSFARMML